MPQGKKTTQRKFIHLIEKYDCKFIISIPFDDGKMGI
jgi:uncharacterized protein Veg